MYNSAKQFIESNKELEGCRVDGMFTDSKNLWIVMPSKNYEKYLDILNKEYRHLFRVTDFAMIGKDECEIRYIDKL